MYPVGQASDILINLLSTEAYTTVKVMLREIPLVIVIVSPFLYPEPGFSILAEVITPPLVITVKLALIPEPEVLFCVSPVNVLVPIVVPV